jgi:hypothetical protein
MTTRYQLEILDHVSGQWEPYDKPARSMTAAYLVGIRLAPPRDIRVVQVDVKDEPVVNEIARRRADKMTHDTSTLEGYKSALEVSGYSIVEKSDGVFDVTRDRVGTTGNELIDRED